MQHPGIKIIRHNAGGLSQPDDPTYPWKLYVNLSPPQYMAVAFCVLHGGSEELVVRGMTKTAIEDFLVAQDLVHHPRFRRLEITGPDGYVNRIPA